MTRETVEQKARRLVREGRLTKLRATEPGAIIGSVRGDAGTYSIYLSPDGWGSCDCPYPRPSCSHLEALRLLLAAGRVEQNATPAGEGAA